MAERIGWTISLELEATKKGPFLLLTDLFTHTPHHLIKTGILTHILHMSVHHMQLLQKLNFMPSVLNPQKSNTEKSSRSFKFPSVLSVSQHILYFYNPVSLDLPACVPICVSPCTSQNITA